MSGMSGCAPAGQLRPVVENAWKTVRFTPAEVARPRDVGEVVALVREAQARGRHITAIGGGHSMNNIIRTDGILADLRHLNQVLSVDAAAGTAEVQGGLTLGDAIVALKREGLHFPSLGSWHTQSVAGAIATSTHGSSLRHGSLSDIVEEVDAVLADGALATFAAEDDHLKAMRTHLGQLGLITRVKLRLAPRFWLQCNITCERDADAFARIVATARRHEYVNMLWLPDLEEACTRVLERTPARTRNEAARTQERAFVGKPVWRHRLQDVGIFLFGHAYLTAPRLLARPYGRAVRRAFFDDDGVVDSSYRVFLYDQYREPTENHRLRMIMNVEYALDVVQLEPALAAMKRVLGEQRRRGRVLNYPRVHIRFTPASDRTLLGLNAGRDTAYVGLYIVGSIRHRSQIPLAEALEEALLAHGGRPHWGKYRYLESRAYEATYGDGLTRFEAVRRELDPGGMFQDGARMFADLNRFETPPLREMLTSIFDPAEYQPIRLL